MTITRRVPSGNHAALSTLSMGATSGTRTSPAPVGSSCSVAWSGLSAKAATHFLSGEIAVAAPSASRMAGDPSVAL